MAEQERIEVEKIAEDRYRLRFRGQIMTVDAQALVDLYDWLGTGATIDNLRLDARNAIAAQNREKPWLPGQED